MPALIINNATKAAIFYAGVFNAGYPQYDNFVNDPDAEFWPSATILNPVIVPVSKCNTSGANGGAWIFPLPYQHPV